MQYIGRRRRRRWSTTKPPSGPTISLTGVVSRDWSSSDLASALSFAQTRSVLVALMDVPAKCAASPNSRALLVVSDAFRRLFVSAMVARRGLPSTPSGAWGSRLVACFFRCCLGGQPFKWFFLQPSVASRPTGCCSARLYGRRCAPSPSNSTLTS